MHHYSVFYFISRNQCVKTTEWSQIVPLLNCLHNYNFSDEQNTVVLITTQPESGVCVSWFISLILWKTSAVIGACRYILSSLAWMIFSQAHIPLLPFFFFFFNFGSLWGSLYSNHLSVRIFCAI